jgi:hypothetical protein
MAGFFKRKQGKGRVQFVDFEGLTLHEGDRVLSYRYDLGECRIINTEEGLVYESLTDGRQVSYVKMIDAATGYQKVKKLS